jgi:hypothetical protein
VFNTVVGQNLIRGQHKADAEEKGENGEDREKHSDRHDDTSLDLSPKANAVGFANLARPWAYRD